MSNSAQVNTVDEILPAPKLFILGLQHVLVMYAGAIAVPLIIGGALKMPKDEIAFLISADLFCCGLVTMLQCIGVWNIGIRLPVMMGVAFTAIAPIIATGTNPELGMQAVFGAVIVSGIFTYLVAPYMSGLVRWFPPIVTGSVVLVIGISLMRVGINWAAGGQPMMSSPTGPTPNPLYGVPVNLAIAGTVLLSVLLCTAFVKGFVANISVLLGITLGFFIAVTLGKVSFAGVATAGWFNLIRPFHFGLPTFDLLSIVTLSVVMLVMMIESTGLFLALGDITGRPISKNDLARGLRADGIGNIIGGIFGTFSYTSYSQNIGLVQMTGVRSRWVCAAAGAILVVLGCLPKMAFLAASIPQYVLGGAAVVMFGMVAAAGIKILTRVDFANNSKNLYIVAVSLGLGMIPLVADRFFTQLPELVAKFFQNGILLGGFAAVALNLLFNYRSTAAYEGFTFEDNPVKAH
ncbi:nucleobase:cation symporter-2 family protein [Undibacterium arcticum]|uniref:Nucleobase:cation symporter-2 family protein n=1 Tax=Undibacterium arcticum TaxID=1762892 RepID=A0ABV7F4G7_9BURK